MKSQIEKKFANCLANCCLELSTSTVIEIFDSEQHKRCFIKVDPADPCHFTIKNDTGKEIHFLAVDKCLFMDDEGKRCDCVVFDDKTFCFIEIKESNLRQKSANRRKAREQLKATIQEFKSKLDFNTYSLEAHVCVGYNQPYPSVPARSTDALVEFEDLDTDLYEGNIKEFINDNPDGDKNPVHP